MHNHSARKGIGLAAVAVWISATVSFALPISDSTASNHQSLHPQAVKLAAEGRVDQSLPMVQNLLAQTNPSPASVQDYIVGLSWNKQDREAIQEFERLQASNQPCPLYVIRAIAKCYRNTKQFTQAEAFYRKLLEADPNDVDAFHGWARVLCDQGRFDEALVVLNDALHKCPANLDLLFFKAEIYSYKNDLIRGVQTYDEILAIAPSNGAAINQKIQWLSDCGGVSKAFDLAKSYGSLITPDTSLHLSNNLALYYIRWGEPHLATTLLNSLIAGESTNEPMTRLRARYDRILALAAMDEMEEVVQAYNKVVQANVKIPYWIHDAAASAYLALEQPKKAIELYKKAIEGNSNRFGTRMGLFYAYLSDEQYEEAESVRARLEADTSGWVWDRGVSTYNSDHQSVVLAKGWILAYQNRLKEAHRFFEKMLKKAPANREIRAGLGQIYQWRGWPHKALEEFEMVIAMTDRVPYEQPSFVQERNMDARNRRILALNDCFLKNEAREYGRALLCRNPKNVHTQRINRSLELEDSAEFFLDSTFAIEYPGTKDFYLYTRLTQPVTSLWDVYAFSSFQQTADETRTVQQDRGGVGTIWDALPPITLLGEYSGDLKTMSDPGLRLRLTWRINDEWTADAECNSFAEVPLRATVAGLDGQSVAHSITYRTSELFEMKGSATCEKLSDGNEQYGYLLTANRALHVGPVLQNRLLAEAYYGHNTDQDVLYFSPDWQSTLMLTHLLQHTVYRQFDRAFVQRLYTGIGLSEQAGFDSDVIGTLRYEQDYLFNDSTSLLWGISLGRRYYDAEGTDTFGGYLTFSKKF